MSGYVYIIQSVKNGRYYAGSTNSLERRLVEHNRGKSRYTSESGPWKLVFSQEYKTLPKARMVEFWLKKQKDRDLIQEIILSGKIIKFDG